MTPEENRARVKAWYNTHANQKIAAVYRWRLLNLEHRRQYLREYKRKKRLSIRRPCATIRCTGTTARKWCAVCGPIQHSYRKRGRDAAA